MTEDKKWYNNADIYNAVIGITGEVGKVEGKLDGVTQRLNNFNGQIKDLTKSINALPCKEHEVDIEYLQMYKKNKENLKVTQGNRRVQMLSAVIGAGIGAGTALGIWYFATPPF